MSVSEFKKVKMEDWLCSSSSEGEDIETSKKHTSKDKVKNKDDSLANEDIKRDEAFQLVERYKNKRLSLKQKMIYEKAKKMISKYESETAQKNKNIMNTFESGQSIFDTKKGQVLFELQKSYKGDDRFKLDNRFAEDVQADKLPNSIKFLTTGIDFENLSDGSDAEFKKNKKKQKKLMKAQKKLEKVEDEHINFGVKEENNDEEEEEQEFLTKKKKQPKIKVEEQSDKEEIESAKIEVDIEVTQLAIERERQKKEDEDYIDQEALEEEEIDLTLKEELQNYLSIMQSILPEDKLFFQNKRKNLKIINNQFTGYAAMLSIEDQQKLESKNKKRRNLGDNQTENASANEASQEKKKANEEEENEKKEKSFNLVIPRFDPSQYLVKKVMESQEKEKQDKIKEKELIKKPKKVAFEAKIDSGIDKKQQKIIKANSILDKNLQEHQKLEGAAIIKRKAPVLKKLKIDGDKWKNIILSSMQNEQPSLEESKQLQAPSSKKYPLKNAAPSKGNKGKSNKVSQEQVSSSNLGFLFASMPTSSEQLDPSRSQFKLFG